MPGPIGKRTDAKHGHRSKAELNKVTKPEAGDPIVWKRVNADWHWIAADWYRSLQRSGQAQFYEQSDVATAYYIAEAMSRNLSSGKFSSMLFSAVMSGMQDLLTTEGARRKARMELQQEPEEDSNSTEMAILDDYRDMLAN